MHENKQANFKKVLSQIQKIAKGRYPARYCDKSNGSFEILQKLFHGTLDDNWRNIAG